MCAVRLANPEPANSYNNGGYAMPNMVQKNGVGGIARNVDAPLALIFGYSMGAMAALHFAALFPDKVARVAAVRLQFQCPPFIFSKKEERKFFGSKK